MLTYKFKFDFNDEVYILSNGDRASYDACPDCVEGFVPLPSGKKLDCPRCKTKGLIVVKHLITKIPHPYPLLVGKIDLEVTEDKVKEKYMCKETGVGSGHLYIAEELFKTLEEAQAYCDDYNGKQLVFLCERCIPLPDGQYRDYGYAEHKDCPIHGRERFWAKSYHKGVER